MATVDVQLDSLRESLEADGYDLRVDSLEGGRLTLSILANDGACEECLVPKPIMIELVKQALEDQSPVAEVVLHYPTDA